VQLLGSASSWDASYEEPSITVARVLEFAINNFDVACDALEVVELLLAQEDYPRDAILRQVRSVLQELNYKE